MATYRARLKEFQDILQADTINKKKLRHLCFNGCPSESCVRPLCWKILLDYLPLESGKWTALLAQQRSSYRRFIDEMIVKPGYECNETVKVPAINDHPLNPNPESQWAEYFKDNEMLVQIDKDCRRLCPDLSFFQSATEFPCQDMLKASQHVDTLRKRVEQLVLYSETVARSRLGITNMRSSRRRTSSEEYATLPPGQEAHWEVCERVLFIYAKLNPGLKYVQGMNEILGPIYYTFASDLDQNVRQHAEADSFFCFTNLMSDIRDNFIKSLDDSHIGIGGLMQRLLTELQHHDYRLWNKLQQLDLKPQYFAFRWITLLLSQEFQLPDVLRVWDSLFADDKCCDFLITVCCAMLILIRTELLEGDFPHNMKLIQNYPSHVEVQNILAKAVELAHR